MERAGVSGVCSEAPATGRAARLSQKYRVRELDDSLRPLCLRGRGQGCGAGARIVQSSTAMKRLATPRRRATVRAAPDPARSVFINCPFDPEYRPLFDAIVFATVSCKYVPRS